MDAHALESALLGTYLRAAWRAGPSVVLGRTAFVPVFGPGGGGPRYVGLAEALERGVELRELPEEPSVRDLWVVNPLDRPVLLLDGEHVLGAKQNRVFDGSFLVPARASVEVPVCCVERDRWQSSRRDEPLRLSHDMGSTTLRSAASQTRVRRRSHRASQGEVWAQVSTLMETHGVSSATSSMADVERWVAPGLGARARRVPRHPGQKGLLVVTAAAQGGFDLAAFDWVSAQGPWADVHERIVRGHLMALGLLAHGEPEVGRPAPWETAALLDDIAALAVEAAGHAGAATRLRTASADARVRASAVHGHGLFAEGHLIHWTTLAA